MRRTGLGALAVSCLVLAAGCGDSNPPASSDPTSATEVATADASNTTTTTTAVSLSSTATDTTTSPTSTTADTTTLPTSTTTEATTTQTTTTETPTTETTTTEGPIGAECSSGAYTPGPLRVGDAPAEVTQTAQALLAAAATCDAPALIARAEADGTRLAPDDTPPAALLGLPDVEGHYLALAVLLSATTPVQAMQEDGRVLTIWPAAAEEGASDAAWQELVDAGLTTSDDVVRMQDAGYDGWRVGIRADGTWAFFVAGD